ncbi:uncharacterized protein B0P05DRAFT_529376 [Gilbertella persicaria]|uniref:uncharacterized protein n=1 Tax=Gilbertella persicaria TaxID=101096 RepID=UPI00221FEA8C|nr:uncharacterized protein B0P05DRAFT_529376 [Gilbertella persicaria]KAI8090108.1 hypothetical protein B0P05DRAFT_529376 [Gilbertella persicaria]
MNTIEQHRNSFRLFLLEKNNKGNRYRENVAVFTYVIRKGLLYFKSAKIFFCQDQLWLL